MVVDQTLQLGDIGVLGIIPVNIDDVRLPEKMFTLLARLGSQR